MTTNVHEVAGTDDQDRILDVVFLHGMNGDPAKTWSTDSPDSFWPAWLARDVAGLGIWSIGYEAWASRWRGPAMPLVDRAVNLLAVMQVYDIGRRPLCFVTHSMGGLVAKQVLNEASTRAQEFEGIVRATRGVVFLATPHTGSGLANVASRFRTAFRSTPAIRDLEDNGPYLRHLNDWYRNNSQRLGVRSLVMFETSDTSGVRVVDETSSNPGLPGVTPIGIDANHANICKPQSRRDLVYLQVKRFVGDLREGAREASSHDSVALSGGGIPEVTPNLAAADAPRRSMNSDRSTYLEFLNLRHEPVVVYWLDFDGNRVPYATLAQGQMQRFQTFITHPWLVATTEGETIAVYEPTEAAGRAVIRAASPPVTMHV